MKTLKKINRFAFFALALLFFTSVNAVAQKERLQTAFIYQLTRLIEWCPEGKEGPFVIAVLGTEPALMTELNALNGRRVGAQQVEVKSFANINDVSKTNILFIPDAEFGNVRQISAALSDHCTLIVSDRSGSAGLGAGVSLVFNPSASALEFEINRTYMRRNSFNVNDQLYRLASKVH